MGTISSALPLGQSISSSFKLEAKRLIKASEKNIAHIDSQISELMRLRDQERGLIASLKVAIAPIQKLSADLLVEIFLNAVDDVSDLFGSSEDVKPSLLALRQVCVLCGVCAYWRRLAVTTPMLWVSLIPISTSKPPSDAYIATAKTFLERSAPLPIPVSLHSEVPEASPLVDFVYSLAPRWRSLSVISSSASRLCSLPRTTLQNLRAVALTLYEEDIPTDGSTVTVFLGAPRLSVVALDVQQTSHFPMPWYQLTELWLTEKSSQMCLDILVQCTNIVTAGFSYMEPWIQSPGSVSITRLSHLHELSLEFGNSEGRHIMAFFRSLDLPALADLTIEPYQKPSWSSADFTAFQRRSPNIEDLTIESCSLSVGDLNCILREAPNLVKLRLEVRLDNSVLELFQYSSINTVHLTPRLQELTLWSTEDNFEETVLAKMIQSRWWTDPQRLALSVPPAVARWEDLYIHRRDEEYNDFGDSSEAFKLTVDRLREEGLKVDIRGNRSGRFNSKTKLTKFSF
ncbi:hypothetical protein B0H11DRAFT_1976317 [Mycena galericulata]|nr:hypothetical protein B0H11DRAFT_1976317 [Mycena galericulata]